jgi:hypothetical protein
MFMNNNSARIKQYSKISSSLACLSNEKLKKILADSKPMHEGIGGKSALISMALSIPQILALDSILDEVFQQQR